MTIGILLLMAGLLTLLALYILHWLKHFLPRDGKSKRAPLLFCVLAVLAALISICIFTTPGLILFHFWLLSMIAEPVVWMFRSKMKKRFFHVLRIGIPGMITALLVVWGAYNIAHPVQTDYTLSTEKSIRPEGYRIVMLTDLHYDTVQAPEVIGRYIRQINETKPDLVILGGDIVEEGTSKARMQEVFQVLSGLEVPTEPTMYTETMTGRTIPGILPIPRLSWRRPWKPPISPFCRTAHRTSRKILCWQAVRMPHGADTHRELPRKRFSPMQTGMI